MNKDAGVVDYISSKKTSLVKEFQEFLPLTQKKVC
jgi:hypothetical protein